MEKSARRLAGAPFSEESVPSLQNHDFSTISAPLPLLKMA